MMETKWTDKLPALVVGVLLLLTGLFATWKGRIAAGIILAVLGLGFVGYSATIKDWCEMKGTTLGQTAWGNGFGASFDQCLRQKGYFSF